MELSVIHQDALTELLNIGVGRAASVLNQMIDSHVDLSIPAIKVINLRELISALNITPEERLASVCLEYTGGFTGATSLVFTTPCARRLVEALTGGETLETDEVDSIRMGSLIEVGNIMVNGIMGSIANILETHIEYQVPSYLEGTIEDLVAQTDAKEDHPVILARTSLAVQQHEVLGDILLFLELDTFDFLIRSLEDDT